MPSMFLQTIKAISNIKASFGGRGDWKTWLGPWCELVIFILIAWSQNFLFRDAGLG